MGFTTGSYMGNFQKVFAGTILFLSGYASIAIATELYRWVDDQGTVHFGDSVPPEYSKTDRQVLNERGVMIKELPGEKTAEELEADKRSDAIDDAERRRQLADERRDAVLLSTYLSIAEIEALRNRRKELLDGQIRVTEVYLLNLREKLLQLQKDASRFQPYNSDPNAPPIHDWLAKELADTLDSILDYQQTLADTQKQKGEMVAKFDADIERFKTLKGLNN
jgi:hypothetical protein